MNNYSEKLERLQELRKLLEDHSIDMETSLKYYEESVVIFKELRDYLNEAQEKFMELKLDD